MPNVELNGEPGTPVAEDIINRLLPEWWSKFQPKNAAYGRNLAQGGGLGIKAFIPEINRKVQGIINEIWHGEVPPQGAERAREKAMDLIGHLLILVHNLDGKLDRGPRTNFDNAAIMEHALAAARSARLKGEDGKAAGIAKVDELMAQQVDASEGDGWYTLPATVPAGWYMAYPERQRVRRVCGPDERPAFGSYPSENAILLNGVTHLTKLNGLVYEMSRSNSQAAPVDTSEPYLVVDRREQVPAAKALRTAAQGAMESMRASFQPAVEAVSKVGRLRTAEELRTDRWPHRVNEDFEDQGIDELAMLEERTCPFHGRHSGHTWFDHSDQGTVYCTGETGTRA